MLKRSKFYLLLLIIVTSTIMGLFSPSEIAFAACPDGKNCITWNGSTTDSTSGYHDLLEYKGETYNYSGSAASLGRDGGFSQSSCNGAPLVYVHQADGGKGYHIVCFKESGTQATFIYFPYGSLQNNIFNPCFINPPAGESCDSVGKNSETVTVDGDAVDLKNAQQEFDKDNEIIDSSDKTEPKPSPCPIDGIGWLICPVVSFIAKITDKSYGLLEGTLLKVEPLALPGITSSASCTAAETKTSTTPGDNIDNTCQRLQLYESWKMMRNIANVVFIILFLIIILSQTTSIGISNYGIKRLLPKLIVAAILVNLSYYLCAIAIDVTNILGNTLRETLMSLRGGNGEMTFHYQYTIDGDATKEVHTVSSGPGWDGLTNMLVGGIEGVVIGGLIYMFLPTFLPIIFAAMLSVVTVVLTLTIRQALIILLIVVSPLAFVALLLPNTESYFNKWRTLFIAMLMVYPIISIVFGASSLASSILMKSPDFTTQMIGAGVSVIPLFITPIVMKVSGGLLNRWVGLVNDPNRGPIDAMKKGVDRKAKRIDNKRKTDTFDGRGLFGGQFGGRAGRIGSRVLGRQYRKASDNARLDAALENNGREAEVSYASKRAQDTAFANQLAGGTNIPVVGGKKVPGWVPGVGGETIPAAIPAVGQASPRRLRSVEAAAQAAQSAETSRQIKEMETLLNNALPRDSKAVGGRLKNAVQSGDAIEAIAAQNVLFGRGDNGVEAFKTAMEDLRMSGASMADKDANGNATALSLMRDSITQDHADMKNIANDVAKFGLDTSGKSLRDFTYDPNTYNSMTAAQTASQKESTLAVAISIPGAITRDTAEQIVTTPQLAGGVSQRNLTGLNRLI